MSPAAITVDGRPLLEDLSFEVAAGKSTVLKL